MIRGRLNKMAGVSAGWPDLFIAEPRRGYHGFFAEFKIGRNTLQAVQQNPTILNPAYTSPPGLVSRSKAALVEVLGEEGALEVMLLNPAVLQCGETLREQPAGQIRR